MNPAAAVLVQEHAPAARPMRQRCVPLHGCKQLDAREPLLVRPPLPFNPLTLFVRKRFGSKAAIVMLIERRLVEVLFVRFGLLVVVLVQVRVDAFKVGIALR